MQTKTLELYGEGQLFGGGYGLFVHCQHVLQKNSHPYKCHHFKLQAKLLLIFY